MVVTQDETSSIDHRNAHMFPDLLKVEIHLIVHFKATGKRKLIHSRYIGKSKMLNVDYFTENSWN